MAAVSSVLVVGAGIGGLVLANGLRRHGIDVTLVDRGRTALGIGIILQGNSLRALHEIELLDELQPRGFPIYGFTSCDRDGNVLARREMVRMVGEDRPATLAVRRPVLADVLSGNAVARGAVLRDGVTAIAFAQDDEGVDVTFSDATRGRFDLVIGADGLNSQVRKEGLGIDVTPQYAGESVWRVLFPRPAEITDIISFASANLVGLVPLDQDWMYLYATEVLREPQVLHGDELVERFQEAVSDCHAPVIRRLVEQPIAPDEIYFRPFEVAFLEGNWMRDRIMVMGDAAHSMTAHMASGAGMAIEDGAVLSAELGADQTLAAAQEAFMRRRYARTKRLFDISRDLCLVPQGTLTREQGAALSFEGHELLRVPH